jgi:hypothetical protein
MSTRTTSLPFNQGLHQSSSNGERKNSVSLIRSPTQELVETSDRPRYTLTKDVLLTIFDLYRTPKPDENKYENVNYGFGLNWLHQRWWYKLGHVCRLWRSIIFASARRLKLNLVCTYHVPVANMLAHSPPL